jgi:tRNA pseudouridine55 synthase
VVNACRRKLGQRRVGHAGTLDPDATGVLLVGVGRATRLLQFLTGLPKSYTCEIVLGTSTTTLDASGEVTGTFDMSGVTLDEARRVASALTGTIGQVPPMVSAVKVGGRRLHQLARAGTEVQRPVRQVTVHRFDLAAGDDDGILVATVECSSGTYVRALAADLGAALGGGAHVRRLRRTAVGPYHVGEAVGLEDVTPDTVRPPLAALRAMARVEVDEHLAAEVAHGRVLSRDVMAPGSDGPWAVIDGSGELLAVYGPHGPHTAKPVVVLSDGAARS